MKFNCVNPTMKYVFSLILLYVVLINFTSCKKNDDDDEPVVGITGEWQEEATIDAGKRFAAVTFTVLDSVYICTGFNGTSDLIHLKDLWVYNSSTKTWQRRADFPGEGRNGAVAFTANSLGYVGLGSNGTEYFKDFYAFNPLKNKWTRIDDFPANGRVGAIAFSIADKGYVGTGEDNINDEYKDFYQYDSLLNVGARWVIKPSVPKTERAGAFSFVIMDKGYVGGGTIKSGAEVAEDLYEYDPIGGADGKGIWNEKNDLKDDAADADTNDKGYTIARDRSSAFVIANKAYVVGGRSINNTVSTQNWEYNPSTDTWKKMNDLEALPRYGAVSFTRGNIGFVGAGFGAKYLNDLFSFDPTLVDLP